MNIFQLAPNDQSVYYLGQLFGNVGAALAGGGPALLGTMFKTLNTALLVVAAFFVMFTTVVGVVKTAHEGKFLGQKWDSLWVPLRILMGVAALFPTKTGYCAIQVVMMWLVVQGVGAADMVWKTAVDYLSKGGAIQAPPPANVADITGPVPELMQKVFASAICQAAVVKLAPDNKNPNVMARSVYDQGLSQYQFGRTGQQTECGTVTIPINPRMQDDQISAMQAIVPVLEVLANQYVNWVIADTSCWDTDDNCKKDPASCRYFEKYSSFLGVLGGKGPTGNNCPILGNPEEAANKLISYAGSNFMFDATKLFMGYAVNYQTKERAKQAVSRDGVDSGYKAALANGWFFAGAYYYYIAKMNNQETARLKEFVEAIFVNNINVMNPRDPKMPGGYPEDFKNANYPAFNAPRVMYCGQYDDAGVTACKPGGGALGVGSAAIKAMSMAIQEGGGMRSLKVSPGKADNPVMGVVGDGIGATIARFGAAIAPQRDNINEDTTNPVVKMQMFGHDVLDRAGDMFYAFVGMIIGFGALSTDIEVFGTTVNYVAGLFKALGTLTFVLGGTILGYMITIGGLLGIYTPLLPFILFTFGSVGWLISIIEAMVAAPFIALGILSPGGQHEILSRAEPSLNIILTVICRPVLMVFGMMAAILLSYIVVKIVNTGFYSVMFTMTEGNISTIEGLLFLMAYVGMVITALNKCFSLIHLIPDKALRWIGAHAETYGEEAAAGEVKGKVGAGEGVASKATGAAGETAMKKGGELKPKPIAPPVELANENQSENKNENQ